MVCLRSDLGDGGRIVLEVDAAPIRDANGALVGAVTVFEDADCATAPRGAEATRRDRRRRTGGRAGPASSDRKTGNHWSTDRRRRARLQQSTHPDHGRSRLPAAQIGWRRADDPAHRQRVAGSRAFAHSYTAVLAFARRQNLKRNRRRRGTRGWHARSDPTESWRWSFLKVTAPTNLPAAKVDPNQLSSRSSIFALMRVTRWARMVR